MDNVRIIDKHNVRTTPGQKNPEPDTWPQHLELANYQLDSTGARKHMWATNGGSQNQQTVTIYRKPHIAKMQQIEN